MSTKTTKATATVPAWSSAGIYTAGLATLDNSVRYRAQWLTQGNNTAQSNGVAATVQPWTIVSFRSGSGGTGPIAAPAVAANLAVSAPSSNGAAVMDSTASSAQTSSLSAAMESAPADSPADNNVAAWSATGTYTKGMTVSEGGLIYQANWWTEGNDPVSNSGPVGSAQPWTVIGKVDTTPTAPDAPTNLGVAAESSTNASLAWSAATVEGSGTVSSYTIFENGKQIGTTTNTNYTVANLTGSATYQFTVSATDATGTSPVSAAASVTMPAPGTVVTPSAEFAPYIDMGMGGNPSLAAISQASGIKTFTLGFVQSYGANTLGWGETETIANDTLPDGSTVLSQIQALRAIGGDVIISFGGAAGTDPAVAATSAAGLQAEYQSVIDRYGVTSLDFDVEGASLANQGSIDLRDQALVGLEAANPDLQISCTLPVTPTGLDQSGMTFIYSAVKDGVHIGVINLMAMDYGSGIDQGGAMGADAIAAIKATESQLASAGLSAKIGIAPMIGINDVSSEVFTPADAQQLAAYVQTDPQVVRTSMWSVSRDNGAGAGATVASPISSGIAQNPYQFSSIFEHA